ncbi:hypothetical protein CROQUDRAFT_713726 [Cronartium quercuum f. sp. fusiforme G11]|uniref:Uncharacterized protein n=1 Tax=Cronartium quercuum f. sp. fusiforme G11 TaxID=708437 RepID=A0A9P6NMG3_9BASI|nr:hypothetical protein CROQUDRAFT_713726 [Cronartium quercuum f. sp. fusiforme G11]
MEKEMVPDEKDSSVHHKVLKIEKSGKWRGGDQPRLGLPKTARSDCAQCFSHRQPQPESKGISKTKCSSPKRQKLTVDDSSDTDALELSDFSAPDPKLWDQKTASQAKTDTLAKLRKVFKATYCRCSLRQKLFLKGSFHDSENESESELELGKQDVTSTNEDYLVEEDTAIPEEAHRVQKLMPSAFRLSTSDNLEHLRLCAGIGFTKSLSLTSIGVNLSYGQSNANAIGIGAYLKHEPEPERTERREFFYLFRRL